MQSTLKELSNSVKPALAYFWCSTGASGAPQNRCLDIVFISLVHARRSGIDHTILPAITPIPAFTSYASARWRLPRLRLQTSSCSLILIYLPRKDERLNWPSWLTSSGRFTHISGHPSAAGWAQDRESSPTTNTTYSPFESSVKPTCIV